MAVPEKLKALVDQMPDPDGKGMFTENIDKQKIDSAIAAICEGGRENIQGLIEMLGKPGSDENVKPHYALHCVANHGLIVNDEKARKEFAETLAAALAGNQPSVVKSFLCQELQWAGGKEATPGLGRLLLEEELVEPASMALIAIREGAAEQFRAALPKARGKCRLNVIQGLGAVEDAESIDVLTRALADEDSEVRLAAGWALARIGNAASAPDLIKAADAPASWERIQATKHCLMLAEKLLADGKKAAAARVYAHLRDTRTEPAESHIREAAEKALAAASHSDG